jgi:hypothetical protein
MVIVVHEIIFPVASTFFAEVEEHDVSRARQAIIEINFFIENPHHSSLAPTL